MENLEPQATTTRRALPLWVYVVSFTLLVAFLVLIGKQLVNTSSGTITVGQEVPPITLTTFDGQTINTADLRGKVVVLNFWASWCKPCEQEAAELEQAWRSYQGNDKVLFLGVNWTDTEPQAKAYLQRFDITYPNGPDLRTKIGDMFRITGVPETYVIGPDGKLADVNVGVFLDVESIQAMIDPHIK